MNPLVSVICVCYNHESFVWEALESVRSQTYPSVEIIIVDDGSRDKSVEVINTWLAVNQHNQFLNLKINQGYCKAFNKALAEAKGEFVIDFATDDVMTKTKIEEQVALFSSLDKSFGVIFTDAEYIDERGIVIRPHFSYLKKKGLLNQVPQGDVYSEVLSTYFIPSPTMMVRASVFKYIGGYDEILVYEDFDFWVRSSRQFKYAFLNKCLMKIRRNINSMSSGWYKKGDQQLHSTYLVCRKAKKLNRTEGENMALAKRLKYEFRQAVFSENSNEAKLFYELLVELKKAGWIDRIVRVLGFLRLPLSPVRKLYHKIKYQSLQ